MTYIGGRARRRGRLQFGNMRRASKERPTERRGPGRPRTGRRSDPDYTPLTVHIRRDTHRDVKIELLQQEPPKQFGELVEELLSKWLANKRKGR